MREFDRQNIILLDNLKFYLRVCRRLKTRLEKRLNCSIDLNDVDFDFLESKIGNFDKNKKRK